MDTTVKAGVVTNALATSSDTRLQKLAEHIVLNSGRLDTYESIRRGLHEVLGTQRFLGPYVTGIDAVGKGNGKKGNGQG